MEQQEGRRHPVVGVIVVVAGGILATYAVSKDWASGCVLSLLVLLYGVRLVFFRAEPAAPQPAPGTSPSAEQSPLPDFPVYLRGYERNAVQSLANTAHEALASDSPTVRAAARAALVRAELPVALRGYDREQVDAYFQRLATELGRPRPLEGR